MYFDMINHDEIIVWYVRLLVFCPQREADEMGLLAGAKTQLFYLGCRSERLKSVLADNAILSYLIRVFYLIY